MAKQTLVKFRTSSTLIILAKDKALRDNQQDFKTVLFNRPVKSSFMPNSAVFPGGVHESSDESPLWRKHFHKMGVKEKQLQCLTHTNGDRPDIFINDDPDVMARELSLRITAVRETFEELGVIFCRDRKSVQEGGGQGYGNFKEDFDRERWQHLVHNDARQFLTLCEELQIVPDLWSLYEWSNWLTPASFKKRFNTAFFIVTLRKIPDIITEANEVKDFAWKTPLEFLESNLKKQLWLPPPQIYELSRLLNFSKLEDVKNFAEIKKEIIPLLPVESKCIDGRVALLPGDDMYPKDPISVSDMPTIDKTIKEYRVAIKNVHRMEYQNLHNAVIQMNINPPYAHVVPLNANPKKT